MAEGLERNLTRLVGRAQAGDEIARNELAALVHDELRRMARKRLGQKFGPGLGGLTIQPTALANDALLRVLRQRQKLDSTGHFFAIASQEMQRVLLDYCRQRMAGKRGRDAVVVSLSSGRDVADARSEIDFVDFNDALEQLGKLDSRKADVVKYRLLWNMSIAETAEALGASTATVERDWQFAKAWLAKQFTPWENASGPEKI